MTSKTKKKFIVIFRYIMSAFLILNIIGIVYSSNALAVEGLGLDSLIANGALAGLSIAFAGWPLLIVNAIKLIFILIGLVLQALMSGFYSSLESDIEIVSLHDIVFAGTGNASKFLDVNFFDKIGQPGTAGEFSSSIAQWYYILRAISVAILLVILIYVGIRMALSNVGQEQAKYKKMFTDWVVSVALLFLLHYIIIFIVQVNTSLVSAIGASAVDPIKSLIGDLIGMMFWVGIEGVFAAGIYLIIIGQIFSFFFLYVKRLITVGFLIMISPLICITYSIDKVGDNKAQALNSWLREITYNILIQAFHCVIYMAFFGAIGNMLADQKFRIGAYVLIIVVMKFMKKAEEILKKIFGFQASSMSSLTESAQTLAAARGNMVKIGTGAAVAFTGIKAAGGIKGLKETAANFKAGRQANRELRKEWKADKKSGAIDEKTKFKEYKNVEEDGRTRYEARKQTNVQKMKQKKIDSNYEKAKEKYDDRHGEGSYDDLIDQKAYEIKNGSGSYDALVEQKAKHAYDTVMGTGAYDALKAKAQETDSDGNFTDDAKDAQDELKAVKTDRRVQSSVKSAMNSDLTAEDKDQVKELVRKENLTETQSGVKRKIEGVKQTTGEFFNSREGKVVKAALVDSTKIAAAMAAGAVALGASGEWNDTILAGQFGFGLAKGILESSSKTVVDGTSDTMRKYLEFTGGKTEDISNILNSINFSSDAIPKMLSDSRKELLSELTKVMDAYVKNDFVTALGEMISSEGASIDIDKLLDDAGVSDEAERNKIAALTKTFTDASLQMNLVQNIKQGQGINMDVDTLSTKVETKLEKVNIDVNFGRGGRVDVDASTSGSRSSTTVTPPPGGPHSIT